MPWNKRTLAIPASPQSVRMARRWVTDVLTEVGRDELIPAAQLGVTEIVTNAILHAEPPLTVRVRGTVEHPRIEVTDQSLAPPQRQQGNDDDFLATYGRGLDLVAAHSEQWGSDINFSGTGKTVWFEPSAEPHDAADSPGVLFDVDDALAALGDDSQPDMLTIDLLGMPTALFAELRHHFHEVSREVRLLALTDPEAYPEAAALAEVFVKVEHERRRARGIDRLDQAIARGEPVVDLRYEVTTSSPETMWEVGRLLERVYNVLHGDELLAVRPDEILLELQRWYFGEFVRQGEGDLATRWEGPISHPHASTDWQTSPR